MHQEQDITWPAGRRLKCQDPWIVKKYNDQVDDMLQQWNILGWLAEVYQDGVVQLTKTQIAKLEDINNVLTTTKLAAEKQCRKVHAGWVPWMLVLTQAIYCILYWKGIKKRQAGGKISGEVLCKWAKQGNETFNTDHLHLPKLAINQKIKTAVQEYKQIKRQSDRRDTWLGQIITAQAEDQNTTKKKLWQRVRQMEQSRQTAKQVKQALGKVARHGGLTQVTVPWTNADPTWICHITKDEIKQACLARQG